MSLFTDSSEITEVYDKILFWGPQHSGKTHAAMSWPELAVVDLENRDAHFKDRFRFKHAPCPDLETLAKILKELKAGTLPCRSFLFDSSTEAYLKLCLEHTTPRTKDGRTTYVTDYTTVNKRDDSLLDFIFSIPNRNVLVIAHAAMKYDHTGQGGDERGSLKKRGFDFKGQEKFRYAFDYIFRTEPTGDPRVNPPIFHVEKSASPNLKVGDKLRGLTYDGFIEITRGAKKIDTDDTTLPITEAQVKTIEQFAGQHRISNIRVADLAKQVSAGATPLVRKLNQGQGAKLFSLLQRESKAVPA